MTTMTNEQFDILAKYGDYFRTAVRSDYARYPGRRALEEIHRVGTELALGVGRAPRNWCSSCVLRLLKTVGRAFLDEKERREAQAAAVRPVNPVGALKKAASTKKTAASPAKTSAAKKSAKEPAKKSKTTKK